ncbi:IS66-like element accessory protein TnpA [Burkholderia ubonensis]|uniref:IS66-like element accessory protein TnpA n=1 Tax=Burkholderia ubonensis TaxID=101571 RepID=UPI001E5D708F|nr:transposase [Burkholderia ubonensis]
MDETLPAKRVKSSKRPNFADEFKRALVEQTFEPGASVSLIARRSDVNTNLLFRWRRQYLDGAFGPPRPEHVDQKPPDGVAALLPVSLVGETAVPTSAMATAQAATTAEGVCEIEFERARVRLRGDVSPATLKLLIRELSR